MTPTLIAALCGLAVALGAALALYLKPAWRKAVAEHLRSPGFQSRLPIYVTIFRKLFTRGT